MKLYTEEQMIQAFNYGKTLEPNDCIEDMLDSLTPIELPSDEEMEGACNEELNGLLSTFGFRKGAKWLMEHIKQQVIP